MKNYCLLFMFFSSFSYGQYEVVDNRMSQIPDSLTISTSKIADFISNNFQTPNDKIRAVFIWTVNNISYDVVNMLNQDPTKSVEFRIKTALETKKGVCMHYAAVFNDIANKIGVRTYVIEGYTKQYGKIATLGHAWCASQIDGKWFLFDPTWGSGYVLNEIYVKKINNSFFKAETSKFILEHMPFDYLWQFLSPPVTNIEFNGGKNDPKKSNIICDFQVEIDRWDGLSESDKDFEAAERIEKNGLFNKLIVEQHNLKKKNFTILIQNKNINKLNSVVINYNKAIGLLNDFSRFRFNKFKPEQSDELMQKNMQDLSDKINKCKEEVYNIGSVGAENTSNLVKLKKSILDAVDQTEKQKTFLDTYLSKGSVGRKLMMSKYR
ncbi:transglutaminase domain-containing protein [Flavobacterium sp.]|uniref:transglutaminase domain-containing protein n=1 Tax=Flavobacterium sp. TaxID=239 RepID=UPI003BBFB0DD